MTLDFMFNRENIKTRKHDQQKKSRSPYFKGIPMQI